MTRAQKPASPVRLTPTVLATQVWAGNQDWNVTRGTVNTIFPLRYEDRLRAIGLLATAPELAASFERFDGPLATSATTLDPAVKQMEAAALTISREIGCTPDLALLMLIYCIVQRWQPHPEHANVGQDYAPPPPKTLTRRVEIYRLWPNSGGDTGSWDTAFVEIPINTPESLIPDVAAKAHHAYLTRMGQDVAGVGFYHLPPLDDEIVITINVDAFVSFAWMYSDLDRAEVLSGARLHVEYLQRTLAAQQSAEGPLPPLEIAVAMEMERLADEWTGMARLDKLRSLGAYIANLAVKELMQTTEGFGEMHHEAICDYVVAPVAAAIESIAASRS